MSNEPPLTRQQQRVLKVLREFAREDHAPTLGELCNALGLRSRGSLHKHVRALVAAGLVRAGDGHKRGIHLTRPVAGSDALPLLGRIAAGRPIEAIENAEMLSVPSSLHGGRASYALEVRGDSMRDAGILDGDRVLVEQREQARNGEMVVALIDGDEATLKYIHQAPGQVSLLSANPDYPPQHYHPDRVRIQGIVVAQYRRYSP